MTTDSATSVRTDRRARLGPASAAIRQTLGDPFDCDNILRPLIKTRGIVFPYTPDVTFGGAANYTNWHFTHSNYQQFQFQNSMPSEIQVTATFTAQTNAEAEYMLAMLTFLRASTMMSFGNAAVLDNTAGTPPPVLRFNYLGDQMFNNVPVVLQNYSYLLEREVDYVALTKQGSNNNTRRGDLAGTVVETFAGGFNQLPAKAGSSTYMPTQLVVTLLLGVQQNPRHTRENFDLNKFKSGDLINKGFI